VWNRQRIDTELADPANVTLGHKSVQRWNLPDGWVISRRPAHPACARRKVERAGWQNVRLLASLDPAQAPHADGIIIGYNPPIVLQRPDLLEAAWVILRPGGRLSAVGARCTTPAGRLAGPFVRLGLVLLGHPGDWHYWTVHEPWQHLKELSGGNTSVQSKLGFEYILCARKGQHVNGPTEQDRRPLS
jgi:hypothetical protein